MATEKHDTMRRSTRLALQVGVLVTTLDLRNQICEECRTVAINAHGCGVIMQEPLKVGIPVLIDLLAQERSKKAKVMVCVQLAEANREAYLVGLEFETPENFWGIENPPSDWALAGKK
ncbi:MAG: hypothetical protein LAN83_14390 [Acidobacteriia bacterium]|nr:hypothetical protein [Terriglobia bacterium]